MTRMVYGEHILVHTYQNVYRAEIKVIIPPQAKKTVKLTFENSIKHFVRTRYYSLL